MAIFVVMRSLLGLAPEALQNAGLRAKTCSRRCPLKGRPFAGSAVVPSGDLMNSLLLRSRLQRSSRRGQHASAHPVFGYCGSYGANSQLCVNRSENCVLICYTLHSRKFVARRSAGCRTGGAPDIHRERS
jgi:hypothetical protein